MNALDLLHKIRTVDWRGNFKYSDTEVLNDMIEMIQGAEAGAREVAIEQERRSTLPVCCCVPGGKISPDCPIHDMAF
jgi:hypothetical protein